MPVGLQRLNAKKSQPNPHIVFIKPLKGPDEATAREFLERIAAQCVPIMRENHLSVVTLEEYEPNREFVGRNFNAGEVIQLVLKTRSTGRWLPFSYVQMVMMHELAHCRQMNHSRAFWAVRDGFAAHMRRLWDSQYTGEGIWGRGARLASSGGDRAYERNMACLGGGGDDDVLLEHLCGGTYRSRQRKRAKPRLSYREQQERRIRRKFGVNGMALGADVAERAKLAASIADGGSSSGRVGGTPAGGRGSKAALKSVAVKPRVAGSKRGRDLRAAAALARFGQQAKSEESEAETTAAEHRDAVAAIKKEQEDEEDSGGFTDSETEDDNEDPELLGPDAVDIDGSRLLDSHGRGMVRVCEEEDTGDDADARRELQELLQTSSPQKTTAARQPQQKRPLVKKEQDRGRHQSGGGQPLSRDNGKGQSRLSSWGFVAAPKTEPEEANSTEPLLLPTRKPKEEDVAKAERAELQLSGIPLAPGSSRSRTSTQNAKGSSTCPIDIA